MYANGYTIYCMLQICIHVERRDDALQWKVWHTGEDWRVSGHTYHDHVQIHRNCM